jgi:hypothetical protein
MSAKELSTTLLAPLLIAGLGGAVTAYFTARSTAETTARETAASTARNTLDATKLSDRVDRQENLLREAREELAGLKGRLAR